MNTSKVLIGGVVVAVAVVIGLTIFFGTQPGKYDDFAKCVSDKGFESYGSNECGACQNQKIFFGSSHKLLSYIECGPFPTGAGWNNPICNEKEISSTPTWFDSSGNTLDIGAIVNDGELAKLSELTGCSVSLEEN